VTPELSVIICTHNPRTDYLARVLAALRAQTLPVERWELLLIDNSSKDPVAPRFDLSWHSRAHPIREDELGLSPARLRGIREVSTELIVFVDDDNVLDVTYLEQVVRISESYPYLGAWSGSLIPEFDEQPPPWTLPYQPFVGIRPVSSDTWAMAPFSANPALPYGAGLCVRKKVAGHYADMCRRDPIRRSLGRSGTSLVSCEDIDLALCACDLSLGTGVFSSLRLIHLMPATRFTLEYLSRIISGTEFSLAMLRYIREGCVPPPVPPISLVRRLRDLRRRLLLSHEDWTISKAREEGISKARSLIRQLSSGESPLKPDCPQF
jgi:glycosyltransferase involved in cell wall biosynthesis